MKNIRINNREIGPGCPVYIIAELSANHNQDFLTAVGLLHAAKEAGADAVKLQTYTADTMTIDCQDDCFKISEGTIWAGQTLYDLYQEAHMPWDWHPKLKEVADDLNLDLFSTPFDITALEFLETLDMPAYKIASFEIVDIPLIKKVAQTGKPIIISTGMATFDEINEAVKTAQNNGADQIALLHCTSAYPAPPEEMNLNTITHMRESFDLPIGLSDHTLGIEVPIAAVSLGACIVEKHITLSRSESTPDGDFSAEPHEFKAMVDAIRTVEKALGEVQYGVTERESTSHEHRRSLFVVDDIKKNDVITAENIKCIRPAFGIAPKHMPKVIGKRATCDVKRGTPLSWDHIQPTYHFPL